MNASISTMTIGDIVNADPRIQEAVQELIAHKFGIGVQAKIDALPDHVSEPVTTTPAYKNGDSVYYTSKAGSRRKYKVTSCFPSTREYNKGTMVVGLRGFQGRFYVEASLVSFNK